MKRIILGTVVTGAVLLGAAATASADVSTNPTTSDHYGYCIANHLANFNQTHEGLRSLRDGNKGLVAETAGNRAPAGCVSTQGSYPPISNH